MQVFKVSEGSTAAAYTLNEKEKKLVIGDIVIDIESEVQDCQSLITITRGADGRFIRGLEGKAGYVADIEIPPREYTVEESDAGDGGDTAGSPSVRTPLPLDLKKVVLRLWSFDAEGIRREHEE
jgi:hypothetical protein